MLNENRSTVSVHCLNIGAGAERAKNLVKGSGAVWV